MGHRTLVQRSPDSVIATVRRFLLMPDLGRCGEVRDEKRSDSLGGFPRVVRAMGKWMEKGASSKR